MTTQIYYCPKCGAEMSIGCPHADGYGYQLECHICGYCELISCKSRQC